MLKLYVGSATSLGVTFVIPQFWTNEQRSVIADICRHADIQLLTIVDDFTALSLNYARTHRITAKGRHVLFADVSEDVRGILPFRHPVFETSRSARSLWRYGHQTCQQNRRFFCTVDRS
jgi:hypothetical protein